MTEAVVQRWLCLAVPVGLLLLVWRRPDRRVAGAALLSFLTAFVGLGLANQLALAVGWWRFDQTAGAFLGVPLDLWLGWALLWGPVPLLLRPRLPLWVLLLVFGWLDVLLMPQLTTLFQLGHNWLYGELAALALTVPPALLLGRWTVDRRRLTGRTLLQLWTFTGLVLWLIPAAVIAKGDGRLSLLWDGPVWRTSLLLQLVALAAVPALSAMTEFAQRGGGTPYPWDPPDRLVTTGPYAYVANPMQLSAVLILGVLAVGTHSWSLALATAGAVSFSTFVADPHERRDLAERLGEPWRQYDAAVRPWIIRRTPYPAQSAELYLAETCTICSQTRGFVESTGPRQLTLRAAEDGRVPALRRALYVGPDGLRATGLAAVARALEHSGPGWAYVGWLLRLPLVRPVLQLLLDGMGGGPRDLRAVRP